DQGPGLRHPALAPTPPPSGWTLHTSWKPVPLVGADDSGAGVEEFEEGDGVRALAAHGLGAVLAHADAVAEAAAGDHDGGAADLELQVAAVDAGLPGDRGRAGVVGVAGEAEFFRLERVPLPAGLDDLVLGGAAGLVGAEDLDPGEVFQAADEVAVLLAVGGDAADEFGLG